MANRIAAFVREKMLQERFVAKQVGDTIVDWMDSETGWTPEQLAADAIHEGLYDAVEVPFDQIVKDVRGAMKHKRPV